MSGLSSIGCEYAHNYNVFDVIIPEGVAEVKGYCSFDGENYTTINCLRYISTCRQIILPNSLKRIGICAFFGIDNSDIYNIGIDIEIPDGVTQIGDYAFDMFALKSISIPASVTQVGKYIFGGAFCGENKLVDGYQLADASDYQLQSVIVKNPNLLGNSNLAPYTMVSVYQGELPQNNNTKLMIFTSVGVVGGLVIGLSFGLFLGLSDKKRRHGKSI